MPWTKETHAMKKKRPYVMNKKRPVSISKQCQDKKARLTQGTPCRKQSSWVSFVHVKVLFCSCRTYPRDALQKEEAYYMSKRDLWHEQKKPITQGTPCRKKSSDPSTHICPWKSLTAFPSTKKGMWTWNYGLLRISIAGLFCSFVLM